MLECKTITATEALYWVAFRQEQSFDKICTKIAQHNEQFVLQDNLVRCYLRHKAKRAAWPPPHLTPEAWAKIEEVTNAERIPDMLAAYKKKTKTTWEELYKRSIYLAVCNRACKRAERKLLAAARAGTVTFYGVQRSRDTKILGERTEIPRAIFMGDGWALKAQSNELLHTPKSPRMAAASWVDLRLEQEQVKKTWLSPRKNGQSNKTLPVAETALVQFLTTLAAQAGGYLPSRDVCCRAAAEHFTGLGKAASDDATRAAIKRIQENQEQYGVAIRSRGRPRRS